MPVLNASLRSVAHEKRLRERLPCAAGPQQRELLSHFLDRFDVSGAMFSPRVNELAVAATVAMTDRDAPVDDLAAMAATLHAVNPLQAQELDLLYDLIALRLAITVTRSESQHGCIADSTHLALDDEPAWRLLARLRAMDPRFVAGIVRHACGYEAGPGARAVVAWLKAQQLHFHRVLDHPPGSQSTAVVPLGDAAHPIAQFSAARQPAAAQAAWLAQAPAIDLGIGPWGEQRSVYTSAGFASKLALGQRRTMHLGLDLFCAEGTLVRSPLAAEVLDVYRTDLPLDYGHAVLLAHQPVPDITFFSLWGHLSAASADALRIGSRLRAGDVIGQMGADDENGGWMPHVHLQLCTYRPQGAAEVIGVGEMAYAPVWAELFPDPTHFANVSLHALV